MGVFKNRFWDAERRDYVVCAAEKKLPEDASRAEKRYFDSRRPKSTADKKSRAQRRGRVVRYRPFNLAGGRPWGARQQKVTLPVDRSNIIGRGIASLP